MSSQVSDRLTQRQQAKQKSTEELEILQKNKLDVLLSTYTDKIDSYKDMIINAYLVGTKKRSVALLESANLKNNKRGKMKLLLDEIKRLYPKIKISLDPFSLEDYPRYFISLEVIDVSKIRDHSDVGELLGMFFAHDPNFSNKQVDRISGHIYYRDIHIYAEVGQYNEKQLVEFKKSLQEKVDSWGEGFRWETEFSHSVKTLYSNWCTLNLDFINENTDEYINLFYNYTEHHEEMERLFLYFLGKCECDSVKMRKYQCVDRKDCKILYELIKNVLELISINPANDSIYDQIDDLVSTFLEDKESNY